MKKFKLIFYISTVLLSLLMMFSAGMYIFNNEAVNGMFQNFGYPTYIVYPLAIAKLLGIITLWIPKWKTLQEWAYAGFFFDFVLAFFAHYMIGDGEQSGAIMALVLLAVSYLSRRKVQELL